MFPILQPRRIFYRMYMQYAFIADFVTTHYMPAHTCVPTQHKMPKTQLNADICISADQAAIGRLLKRIRRLMLLLLLMMLHMIPRLRLQVYVCL